MIELPPTSKPTKDAASPGLSPEAEQSINDINEKYLYWSEVKYRSAGTGLTAEELWHEAKRRRLMKDVVAWPEFNIHFSLNNNIQHLCQKFDMYFGGRWEGMELLAENTHNQWHYIDSTAMEEAISSSQMEGASTTRQVAKDMLRKKLEPLDRSQKMIYNNYQTIRFIVENRERPLTKDLLLEVHSLITADTLDDNSMSGRMRENDDIVVGNGVTGEVVHRPPSHTLLDKFVDELCTFFNATESSTFIHPIIRALIVHFLIAYYHPFVDGNGRTARALFYWYMLKANYEMAQYLSISRIIYKSKSKYEKSFLYSENDSNDIGYFLTYNLDVLSKAFDELKLYLMKKQAETRRAGRYLHIEGITARQAEIIRMYADAGDITLQAKDIAGQFGVSRVSAKNYLDGLADKGILTRIQLDGRTRGYIKSERIDEITRRL